MTGKGKRLEAVGYLRTSSAANVGEGKDSEQRQRLAIDRHAKASGFVIVAWFYDAAVSGADPVEARPGFAAMLSCIAGNGVRTKAESPHSHGRSSPQRDMLGKGR
jgi:hypothetical protein